MKLTIQRIRLSAWLLLGILLFTSCEKPDNRPQLEFQVVDVQGRSIYGAYAGLFDSYEGWLSRENPVQVWRTTSNTGEVIFTDLEEKQYFFYVRYGKLDNSMGQYHLAEPLTINERRIIKVVLQ